MKARSTPYFLRRFTRHILLVLIGVNFVGNCVNAKISSPGVCTGRPNIVFIVADDAGWNDFSFHGSPQIPTPNIDALALTGVILNSYYGAPLCTPTRGAILTGKHPIHLRLQHYVILGGSSGGLPLEEKLLPQYLKEFDYATHLVGKWHLGHSKKVYTPTYRGFDSHFGYWLGKQDYYDHFAHEGDTWGYDFRSNLSVNYDAFGIYNTDVFTQEAIRLIQAHPKHKPLFLMLNHIAPHSSNKYQPLQAPEENIQKFANTIQEIPRRMYAGVVDKLDESVGLLVAELLRAQMLDNTIIVFTSDNGGAPLGYDLNQGSNWPLRGVKNTLWEGGTRIAGFIWNPFLLPSRVSRDMFHVQDWLPTLYEAIGGDVSRLGEIDGVSQWSPLKSTFTKAHPVRTEFLYSIDDIYNNSAIRIGPWKLIQGNTSPLALGAVTRWDGWYGPSGRDSNISISSLIPAILDSIAGRTIAKLGIVLNVTHMEEVQKDANIQSQCMPKDMANDGSNPLPALCDPYNNPCLFNIDDDPCEFHNLAKDEPLILATLLSKLEVYNKTALPPNLPIRHPESNPRKWGYVWSNWEENS